LSLTIGAFALLVQLHAVAASSGHMPGLLQRQPVEPVAEADSIVRTPVAGAGQLAIKVNEAM